MQQARSEKGSTLKCKNFRPMGANSFSVDLFSEGTQGNFDIVAAPLTMYPFPLLCINPISGLFARSIVDLT